MLKKIEILPIEKKDFSQLERDLFVDTRQPLGKQPICLSYGTKWNEYVPFVTYGEFSCLVGPAKAYKSFFKGAMLTAYLGGNSKAYFKEMMGHANQNKFVIDFDTEQGDYHASKAFKRVETMYGKYNSFYVPFTLRKLSAKERVEFIEYIVWESGYKDHIGLISIDGVADLIDNVNDPDGSNEIVQKLMRITQEKKLGMITVIHRNYDTQKATGWLGSAIMKKAETVLMIEKNNKTGTVKPQLSRNIDIDEINFTINDKGLPIESDNDSIFE